MPKMKKKNIFLFVPIGVTPARVIELWEINDVRKLWKYVYENFFIALDIFVAAEAHTNNNKHGREMEDTFSHCKRDDNIIRNVLA